MIVLDASVVALALAAEGDEAHGVRQRLMDGEAFAPELLDLEVTAYVRRAVRRSVMGAERAIQALADLAMLPVSRVSHTPYLSRIWDLRDNVTPYDAAYVALAETLDAPLLTVDGRLAKAPGIRCEVVLLA